MSQENEIEAKKLSPTTDFLPSDGASCSAIIRNIPKTPQSQHALCDQLSLLWAAANRLGLYDAADFIRPHMAGNSLPNA